MKYQFIICLFFASLLAMGQQTPADTINKFDKEGRKQGYWVKKDGKGFIVYQGQFKDDKPYGKFIFLHSNGKLKSVTYYWKNSNQAHTTLYNKEGRKVSEGKVFGEAKDSTWNFYENDILVLVENYKQGKKHGVFKKYYQNGKLMDERSYKNDVLDGPVKMYYPDEKLKMKGTIVNGLFEGESVFYFPKGQVQAKGNYLHDYKEGKWTRYLEDGTIEMEIVFKKSKELKKTIFNGEVQEFYSSGLPKSKTTYKNGVKNGLFVEYFDAGEIKLEEIPATQEGYPSEKKEVIVGQKESKKGYYKNNKLEGKLTFYKEDGSIEKEETYQDGALVK